MYKYTIITLIVNNYEFVREIPFKDDDVEYLLITDNKNLKSDTWTIIYEPEVDNDLTSYEKVWKIKWNKLFSYCHSPYIFRIDGSIQLLSSLENIYNKFKENNYDLGIVIHPDRNNYFDEYDTWVNDRGLNSIYKERFINYCIRNEYNLNYKGLVEPGVIFIHKNDITINLFKDMYRLLQDNDALNDQDQCWFTLNLINYKDKLNIWALHDNIMFSQYMRLCYHNTNNYVERYYNYNKDLYLFNERVSPEMIQYIPKCKCCILIMSCNDQFFYAQEEIIKQTYLTNSDVDWYIYKSGNETKIDGHYIYCNCSDDLDHTFIKTKMAFEQIKNKYDYIIHTNTSTYININLLKQFCDYMYDYNIELSSGDISILNNKIQLRGNDIILSNRIINYIIDFDCNELNHAQLENMHDDVVISYIMEILYNGIEGVLKNIIQNDFVYLNDYYRIHHPLAINNDDLSFYTFINKIFISVRKNIGNRIDEFKELINLHNILKDDISYYDINKNMYVNKILIFYYTQGDAKFYNYVKK